MSTLVAIERLACDLWRLKVFRANQTLVRLVSTIDAPWPMVQEMATAAIEWWSLIDEVNDGAPESAVASGS